MTIKEKEDAMGAAMKANGAFWAFGDSQFDEQKDPAIDKADYCHIFGGHLPQGHRRQDDCRHEGYLSQSLAPMLAPINYDLKPANETRDSFTARVNDNRRSWILAEAISAGETANNTLDNDMVAECCQSLRDAKAGQPTYEAMLELAAAIETSHSSTFPTASLNSRYVGTMGGLVRKAAADYSLTMSMLEHVTNRNGEALELMETAASAGEVVRII